MRTSGKAGKKKITGRTDPPDVLDRGRRKGMMNKRKKLRMKDQEGRLGIEKGFRRPVTMGPHPRKAGKHLDSAIARASRTKLEGKNTEKRGILGRHQQETSY